jgi:hypothetical protein
MTSRFQGVRDFESGREQRRSPRVDVMRRVNGVLAAVDTPILVHDLSRTGFAVVSRIIFSRGETLEFLLVADNGPEVRVTARAIHTRPFEGKPDLYLSGFEFVPGGVSGFVPHALIDRLIDAVKPPVSQF